MTNYFSALFLGVTIVGFIVRVFTLKSVDYDWKGSTCVAGR